MMKHSSSLLEILSPDSETSGVKDPLETGVLTSLTTVGLSIKFSVDPASNLPCLSTKIPENKYINFHKRNCVDFTSSDINCI